MRVPRLCHPRRTKAFSRPVYFSWSLSPSNFPRDPVSFFQVAEIENKEIRHNFGITLLPSNINNSLRIDPDTRKIEPFRLAIRSIAPHHLPKERTSTAWVDHCLALPSRLQARSLWVLLTNEDGRHCANVRGGMIKVRCWGSLIHLDAWRLPGVAERWRDSGCVGVDIRCVRPPWSASTLTSTMHP